jgi:endoglucanase
VLVTYTLFTDWLTGYCVGLNIHNPEPAATANWVINLDIGADTAYNLWNAEFSSLTGPISLEPLSWNQHIQPGETNVSIGLCVNRVNQNGSLPAIGVSSATFQ